MTDYVNLTDRERGFLLKEIIAGTQSRANGEKIMADGTKKVVNNLPTGTNIEKFQKLLASRGSTDLLLNKFINIRDEDLGILGANLDLSVGAEDQYSINIAGAQGEAFRKLGYEIDEIKINRQNTAITNPKRFLELKERDIQRINKESFDVYQKAYVKYREYGYSDNDAFDKAKRASYSFKNEMMKEHDIEFPEKLYTDAKSRIGQNIAG